MYSRRIALLLLCCLLQLFAAAQPPSPADSVAFVALTDQYKQRLQRHPSLWKELSDIFYQKSNALSGTVYAGKAAIAISEALAENKQNAAAKSWYNQAIRIFEKSGDANEIGFANLRLGKVLTANYDFEGGFPYLYKSVEAFEKAGNYNQQAKAYNSISLAQHDFGNFNKGREYALLARQTLDAHPKGRNDNIYWYVYNNLGINADDNKQPQEAIAAHLKALPYANCASDSSYSYNNLGNTCKKIGQLEAAIIYFRKAILTSYADTADRYHRAGTYSNMLDILRLTKNYPEAYAYLDSALYFANQSGSPEKLIDLHNYASQLEAENGNWPAASHHLQQYLTLKDSLLSAEKARILYNFEVKYETEKNEKDLAQAKLKFAESELASNRKNRWLLLLGATALLAVIGFRNYRIRARLHEKQLRLENRLLQEQETSRLQEQRLQIARDLHDSLGAQLTIVTSMLRDMQKPNTPLAAKLPEKLDTLTRLSESATTELKNALWVLNTKLIRLEDLWMKMLAFKNSAATAKPGIAFDFRFDITADFTLDSREAAHVLRIFQEILNNSLKHSQATAIAIHIRQQENTMLLHIRDNGIGFDYEAQKNRSFGLTNIEDRVAQLQGTLHVETAPAQGTAYHIVVQLHNATPAAG